MKIRCYHVEYDLIFEQENGNEFQFNVDIWKKSRDKALERVLKIISNKSDYPLVVIVDDNFYYTSMRYIYYKLAKESI